MIIAWLLLLPFVAPIYLLAALTESLLSLLAALGRRSFTFFARSSSVFFCCSSGSGPGGATHEDYSFRGTPQASPPPSNVDNEIGRKNPRVEVEIHEDRL
jgi:hypothetical protein